MDRQRTLAALALGVIAAALPAIGAPTPMLREMRWIDPALPRTAVVGLLTTEPAECLNRTADAATAASIAIGRAAFRAPLLLGGQAARAGVSCASCHPAGRSNRHFVFPGVSGVPGTADVTSSLFSRQRGDGIANPRRIPDLAADRPAIDRDPTSPALRHFIHGLVVEEFDGLEPSAAVLDGLTAYVRALGGACGGDTAQTAEHEIDVAASAVESAIRSLAALDAATAHLLIGSARSALGRLDERYTVVPGIDRRLEARDSQLRRVQALAQTDPAAATRALDRWRLDFSADIPVLRNAADRSLYAPAVLERALIDSKP